ncbi:MAG: hypothetical protein OXI57_08535 [Rhodospirillales bacterium]|nr:hypothetical protein [Rhodospirillales bacterium]
MAFEVVKAMQANGLEWARATARSAADLPRSWYGTLLGRPHHAARSTNDLGALGQPNRVE